MWLNFFAHVFVSTLTVVVIHLLYSFVKDKCTVNSRKDVYQIHKAKYQEIFKTIEQQDEYDKEQKELLQFALDESLSD